MLSFAFVLALVSVVFEAMIASRSRALRQLAGRRVSVNLGVSLGLSVVLGVMFGAVGLIALTAGLMSTVMAIPVYRFLHWNFDSAQAVAANSLSDPCGFESATFRSECRRYEALLKDRFASALRSLRPVITTSD
jgi:hypothetical protein